MKTIKFFAVAAAALFLAAACKSSTDGIEMEAQLPTNAERDSVSYLVGVQFGYFIKANNFGEDLNYAQVRKGMMDFINAEGNIRDEGFNNQFKISPELTNTLFNAYIGKRNAYNAELNLKKGEKFLEENFNEAGIVATESGLQYRIVADGNEVKPTVKDTVYVHYTGTLLDGTQFDASDKTKDPVKMLLNRTIEGWKEGLPLIGEGGKIQLYVPADLAYGTRRMGQIEPNSTLIFDIDLVKVGKAPVEEEKDAKKK